MNKKIVIIDISGEERNLYLNEVNALTKIQDSHYVNLKNGYSIPIPKTEFERVELEIRNG